MSDEINNEHPESEESFADLLEAYSAGMKDDLAVGDKINAKIIAVGADSIFLDTGTKMDGVVERSELLDDDGNLPFQEGETIELFVIAMDEHEIRLSKAISGVGGLALLQDAYDNEIPVEGKVSSTCKGGFNVELLHRRAFCPISQIDVNYVEIPDQHVGQTYEFLITQLEDRGKNIVVSRRKLLARAMEKEKAAFFKTLQQGDVLQGRVTRLMPYGAFVELIPGVEGMVHISELSWSRAETPEDVVRPDEKVSVVVLDIANNDKQNQKKISLSMKQVDGDPWETVTERVKPGEKINGKVTRCLKFGAFVQILPGIEGLVHISEMSYLKRVVRPEDVVSKGDTIAVLVKEIDTKSRRISLSIRDAQGDPWLEVSDNYKVGQVVEGVLEKKESFGYFITLSPGITGLLPKSKFRAAENPSALEHWHVDDKVVVLIEEIHPADRKITLAPGDAKQEDAWQEFAGEKSDASMGDLAEKLRQAIAAKK